MRPIGEVEFVQGLAAASASDLYGPGRAAAAIVGHANLLLGDRVAPVLEALQVGELTLDFVCGGVVDLRMRVPRHRMADAPEPVGTGLSLEGWMYFPQLHRRLPASCDR
jgi:hypothetical protein